MPSLLSFLFGSKPKTAEIARERLKLIIAHERGDQTDKANCLPPALQKELVEVISRYFPIQPEDINIAMEKQGNCEMLEVNIVLPGSGARPS
jgi:cell division topological specificity factor